MQKVILDLLPGGVAPIVYASQYDDGRSIRFMLTEGGPDSQYSLNASEVITCNLTKPDETETVINVANPGAGKTYVDLVNGADDYDQAGTYLGEIVLTKDARVIGSANFVLKVEEDAYGGQITTSTATGNPCTFETNLADALVSLTADIVCGGGGGTPSTPIPLVPHTELNLTRCGINQFDEIWEKGTINQTTGAEETNAYISRSGFIPIAPNTRYYYGYTSQNNARGYYYDSNKNYIGTFIAYANNSFVSDVNASYLRISIGDVDGIPPLTINYPSTDTEYHSYDGQTFTVAFGQTVYGGVYDKSGRLTITHTGLTFNGSENWSTRQSGVGTLYEFKFTESIKAETESISNMYVWEMNLTANNTFRILESGNIRVIAIHDDNRTDLATFKSFLSNNNLTICVELATPIVIDVPSISVFAENGTNNIVSDCLGDVDVAYIKKV